MKKPATLAAPAPAPQPATDEFLRLAEVAREWKVSRATVYRAIESGQLRAFNAGCGSKYGAWRVTRSDMKAYVDAKSTRPVLT